MRGKAKKKRKKRRKKKEGKGRKERDSLDLFPQEKFAIATPM